MRPHAWSGGPRRPAIAHIVRIGTEKVRSLPYRSASAAATRSGRELPAARAIQASAEAAADLCSGPSANASAAQTSAVVLMLLTLSVVSPQPPSAFRVATSQRKPSSSSRSPLSTVAPDRPAAASAVTAVAVARALLDRCPSQCPAATRASCRAADGGYANHRGAAEGSTPATAAAVTIARHLDAGPDPSPAAWLLARCHPEGGFVAAPGTPIPDLLSTATALHALAALHMPIDALREPCLDFLDTLWTSAGGFHGSWPDETLDCEYTYYGLLALGHLSL